MVPLFRSADPISEARMASPVGYYGQCNIFQLDFIRFFWIQVSIGTFNTPELVGFNHPQSANPVLVSESLFLHHLGSMAKKVYTTLERYFAGPAFWRTGRSGADVSIFFQLRDQHDVPKPLSSETPGSEGT